MNLIFFGSSQYSLIVAEALYKRFGLRLIVTKPGPVAAFAQKNSIPFITPDKLTDKTIQSIPAPVDFFVIADYGLILPKKLLQIPTYAPLNVHHSLLPKYRGPTPAPSAILHNEKMTGVTIIKMDEHIDAGDILAQKEYAMKPDETTDSLLKTLNALGTEILIPVIEHFQEAIKYAKKQDEAEATYTPRLTRESGYIDVKKSKGLVFERMIRAYYPWPGMWTLFRIKNKELRIKFLPNQMVQVEGKNPMGYKDFSNGYPGGKTLIQELGLI